MFNPLKYCLSEQVNASVLLMRHDETSPHCDNATITFESNYQSSSKNDSDDDSCNDESIGQESELDEGLRAQECIELLNSDSESDDDAPCNKENELVDSEEEPVSTSTVRKNKRRRISKISDHFKPKSNNTHNKQNTTTQKKAKKITQSPIVLDDSSIEEEPSYLGGRRREIPPSSNVLFLSLLHLLPVNSHHRSPLPEVR